MVSRIKFPESQTVGSLMTSRFISFITRSAVVLLCAAYSHAARCEPIDSQSVALHYARIVEASYLDSLSSARDMQRAIAAFVAKPNARSHAQAKARWLAARKWYSQTEAYRFYAGPIDDTEGPEGRINSWPVDEAYMDSVRDSPGVGIINDPKVRLTRSDLSRLNLHGGEENVATGWHAIEFLLWGQDFNADGPGQRSFEDFVDGKGRNAKRRRKYLEEVTALLIDDLTYLVQAWTVDADNYRSRFIADPQEAVRRMFVGIGALSRSELAGERLDVPLATQDQEDEQSCFSDSTHSDIASNVLGIENVWLGRYRRIDGTLLQGPSLRSLVASISAELAAQTTASVAASLAAANSIQPPFDREIRGDDSAPGRIRLHALIKALNKQTDDFVLSAEALGITRLTMTTGRDK